MSEAKINFKAVEILTKIVQCTELHRLEADGFLRGERKGKRMNVPWQDIVASLDKQYHDWLNAYAEGDPDAMKRTLADLRNLAGCVFLKIKEKEAKETRL